MEKLQLLESVLGKSSPAHRDNVSFHCPFCGHPKPKLNVSLGTGAWGCWVCGQTPGSKARGRSVAVLFHRLGIDDKLVQHARNLWKETKVNKKEIDVSISLPSEYIPLWVNNESYFRYRAYEYVKSRGITDLDIIKYRIGYCVSGRYSDMIILPSFDERGILNFFVGRSYLPNPKMKFLIPANIDKDIICYESTINWSLPVVIVESQLNAITIRRNAIPLNGKAFPNKLKEKIIETRPPKIVMCLDGDAMADAMRHAEYFISNGIPVYCVRLPTDEDANSVGFDSIWKFIDNAPEIDHSSSFSFKIYNLLN